MVVHQIYTVTHSPASLSTVSEVKKVFFDEESRLGDTLFLIDESILALLQT